MPSNLGGDGKDPFTYKCLVLNSDYQPLSTWPLSITTARDAIETICKDHADVVEEWDIEVHSPSITMKVPKVIVLKEMAPVYGTPKFNRKSIFLRDLFICQYCGNRFPVHELTYDHVHPRDKGGKTTWENIITSCYPCNQKKKNRTDIRPMKMPHIPTHVELIWAGLQFLPESYQQEFGQWLGYWDVELEP